jgi:hypothetical protein
MFTRRRFIQSAGGAAALALMSRVTPALAQASQSGGTLGAIRAATITVSNLSEVEKAWTQYLGYRVVERRKISSALAKSWAAPKLAGKRMVILGPASGEPTFIRFVEQQRPADYDAANTYGWRVTEITVENSEKLYEHLKDSPFELRGPPGTVPTYPYLRPLGATGPGGERLAFTWITEPRPDLAAAKSFVGRFFLAAHTTPDIEGSLKFIEETFGNKPSPVRRLPNFALATVTLKDGTKLEVDEFRGDGRPVPRVPGGLPMGEAIVTFECSDFAKHTERFIGPAVKGDAAGFKGHRLATIAGHAGELIELLEV